MALFKKKKRSKRRKNTSNEPNDRVSVGNLEAGLWFGDDAKDVTFTLNRVDRRNGKRFVFRSFRAYDLRSLVGLLKATATWFSFEQELSFLDREELRFLASALDAVNEAVDESVRQARHARMTNTTQ